MSSKSEDGYVRVKERIPYQGKGADELVGTLRRILTDNKFTQKITLEVGVPYIAIEKMVKSEDNELPAVVLSTHDIIRNRPMQEYTIEEGDNLTPFLQLWEMFSMLQKDGFEVCRILAGNRGKFGAWLGTRIPQNDLTVFGTTLEIIGDLPSDVFIVCGAKSRTAEPEDIETCIKGTTV